MSSIGLKGSDLGKCRRTVRVALLMSGLKKDLSNKEIMTYFREKMIHFLKEKVCIVKLSVWSE